MYCLTRREYRRWLRLEAEERRTAEAEAELRRYLDAIAAAERQVRRWVVAYLRARQGRRRCEEVGVGKAEIYRAVARRLPDVWGLRMATRLRGRYHGGDEPGRKMRAFAGKILILDEALLALCCAGRVETVDDGTGDTAFRWCSARQATRKRHGEDHVGAGSQPAPRQAKVGRAQPPAGSPSPAACRPDLCTFLASLGTFVGFDE